MIRKYDILTVNLKDLFIKPEVNDTVLCVLLCDNL